MFAVRPIRSSLVALVAVPWDAFVGAFLYYAILTLVVLGGADLDSPVMAAAYLAVPVAYGLVVARRAMGALARAAAPTVGDTQLVLH
jgi:hypothetical protein